MHDYVIVGAGMFGAAFARLMKDAGKNVLIIERGDVGGTCSSTRIDGIDVHSHGAHIFRTNEKCVWEFVNRFSEFNRFTSAPIANYNGRLFNLPFNMNTFHALWGVKTPEEARAKIESQRKPRENPRNLEEQALNLVGWDIYEMFIRDYTEKQWGKSCKDLPPEIIRRLPLRFTFDNDYYNSLYQGIPIGGWSEFFRSMLDGIPVVKMDYKKMALTGTVVYTGCVAELYDYRYGPLPYRGLKFEHKRLPVDNYQGVAVMNFTGKEPYTRIIEHKHFQKGTQPTTVITYETPEEWRPGTVPYYPVENEESRALYARYKALADKDGIILGGRLGEYKYYDMQDTILSAMRLAERELS